MSDISQQALPSYIIFFFLIIYQPQGGPTNVIDDFFTTTSYDTLLWRDIETRKKRIFVFGETHLNFKRRQKRSHLIIYSTEKALASIVEVGSLYSLPTRPVLASEVASRRAAWPSATSPVRTSAVLLHNRRCFQIYFKRDYSPLSVPKKHRLLCNKQRRIDWYPS